MTAPSPNGRDGRGRFAKGNKGGPGNPYAGRVAELRTALFDAVTPEDIRAIIAVLVTQAKSGDLHAAREVLDRCLGRPANADFVHHRESFESLVGRGE